jgi:putative nucleotidyltransferase with HDIG domain
MTTATTTGQGGQRLAAAFERASSLPALAEARQRLLEATAGSRVSATSVVDAVESDPALTIAVLRAANNGGGPPGRCESVDDAVGELTPAGVGALADAIAGYDVFATPGPLSRRNELFRRHALTVRDASERIALMTGVARRGHLVTAALLHDVGRLVLADLGAGSEAPAEGETPEERLRVEREGFGIDHAAVGAVLVRRWRLPPTVAAAVERHHADDATGAAAVIKLADLVAHYVCGSPIPLQTMLDAARPLGLNEGRLRALLYEFPGEAGRPRSGDPCPLTPRELEVLRALGEGKVYKQIARELGLSASTIRSHLQNVYRKVGAVDRAQAVLIARDKGWL